MMELNLMIPSAYGTRDYGGDFAYNPENSFANERNDVVFEDDVVMFADDFDIQREQTIGKQDPVHDVWMAGSFRREPEWDDCHLPFRVPKSPSIVVEIPTFPHSSPKSQPAPPPTTTSTTTSQKSQNTGGNTSQDTSSAQLSPTRKSRRVKKPRAYSPESFHLDEDDYNNLEDEDDNDDDQEESNRESNAQQGILPSRGRPDWESLQRPSSDEEEEAPPPSPEKIKTKPKKNDKFECFCGNVYDTKRLLKKHRKLRHGKYKNQSAKEKRKKPKASQRRKEEERRKQEEAKRNAKSAVPKDCIVPGCKFKSSTDNEMDRHIAQHYMKLGRSKQKKESTTSKSKSSSNTNSWRKSLKMPSKETHSCPICSYTATVLLSFEIHLATHIGKGKDIPLRYSCDVCGLDLDTEDEKLEHFEQLHVTMDDYIRCDFCDYQVRQLDKVIEHRRRHSNERPHLCPDCGFRCTTLYNLKKHLQRKHKSDITNPTFYPESNYLQEVLEKFGVEEPMSD